MKAKKMDRMNRKNLLRKKRHERGDFVVSLIVGLIISALIAAAAYTTFRDSSRDEDIKQVVKQVNTIAGNFRNNFGIDNRYGDITTAIAVQTRTIPEELRINGTNTAQNMFGGDITATPSTLTSTNDAVDLSLPNIPAWACSRTVQGTQSVARRITVGGQAVKPLDDRINTATLATACDGTGPFTIVWSIGRTAA